ncbi:hypothetical protein HD597_007844 [Nonomuraea thailandensis]|uniref:Uncharacterized protein n=1 Tax=Nonomuraea thailandensis TaxID=1188745 RepID=A0A9X2GKF6_9ACTN|nr:hypothetical protein [Nonomuraea thailandensis]
MVLGPLSPPWIEAVPPWNAPISPPVDTALSPSGDVTLSPPGEAVLPPPPGVIAPPPEIGVPAETTARGRRPPHAGPPGRSPSPPRERPAPPDRAQALPTPRVSPQAPPPHRPSPSRSAVAPPPARGRGLPNPCATMHDFRRQPCEQALDRLTR